MRELPANKCDFATFLLTLLDHVDALFMLKLYLQMMKWFLFVHVEVLFVCKWLCTLHKVVYRAVRCCWRVKDIYENETCIHTVHDGGNIKAPISEEPVSLTYVLGLAHLLGLGTRC